MDKPGLVDWAILPLTWFERSRGWKQRGFFAFYLFAALVLGLIVWRSLSLWGLPDIGDPFDVARLEKLEVPDASNAMVLYRNADAKLIGPADSSYHVTSSKAWNVQDWATADPEVLRWVVDNRPALATWLEGTERPDSFLAQPRDLTTQAALKPLFSLQPFAKMASLEASRLEADGDLEGAWQFHRAILRTSRHAGMHGPPMQRGIGQTILMLDRPGLLRWMDDTRVTPALLRRAIADVEACKAMTAPNSEMIRAEYSIVRSAIEAAGDWPSHPPGGWPGEPPWYESLSITRRTRHFLRREPERTRRVHALITAGILAQCDRPRSARAKLIASQYMIYDLDPATPPAVAAIAPEDLASWADRSGYATIANNYGFLFTRIEVEANTFDTYLLRMAERAFELEHGQPPKTHADLLGAYLKALPEGIEPTDLTSPSPAPN